MIYTFIVFSLKQLIKVLVKALFNSNKMFLMLIYMYMYVTVYRYFKFEPFSNLVQIPTETYMKQYKCAKKYSIVRF